MIDVPEPDPVSFSAVLQCQVCGFERTVELPPRRIGRTDIDTVGPQAEQNIRDVRRHALDKSHEEILVASRVGNMDGSTSYSESTMTVTEPDNTSLYKQFRKSIRLSSE